MSVSRYVWVFMHFRSTLGHCHFCSFLTLFGRFLVQAVKLLSHIIDMFFCALRGVNGSSYTDFDYFIWDFGTSYQKWHFMPHAKWRQRALKCHPWNRQSTISMAYKFTWICMVNSLFKMHTHSCFCTMHEDKGRKEDVIDVLKKLWLV
jgi:hypothetical protein